MSKTSEEYWKILNTINEWIRFSDLKAGAILSVYGIILTVIYSNSEQVFKILDTNSCLLFISIVAIITSIISVFLSFLTLNPSLKNKNPHSIIFFGHIQNKFDSYENYDQQAKEIISGKKEYRAQLAEQIHINSTICWSKYKKVSWSIRFFISTILLLLTALIIYLIISL